MKNIEWATKTWNPLTGCKHNCKWTAPDGKVVGCYAKAISDRFKHQPDFCEVVYHEDRASIPAGWKKPQRIFVCSMADLFGDWVDEKYIRRVLEVITDNPRHTFLLLTKNPKRLAKFTFPDNAHVGFSFGDNQTQVARIYAKVRWISFEPLTNDVCTNSFKLKDAFDWVVIGALSAGGKKYHPEPSWVEHILEAAEGLPVFMKDNLDCGALGIERRQELPGMVNG